MNVLFLADAVGTLRPLGDSTLVLVREALKRGHRVHWALPRDVGLDRGAAWVNASPVKSAERDQLPQISSPRWTAVTEFNAVFIRKDPPFDPEYVKLCWLLALEESRVYMMNKPSLLLRYHEKLLPFEAMRAGFLNESDLIPTFLGPREGSARFSRDHLGEKCIMKPFYGFGGREVELVGQDALERGGDRLVQPFVDEIHVRGDRRVIYLDGEILGHFARMPRQGHYVSNLAQGGSAAALPFTDKEKDAAERLGKFLKQIGIHFAGADMIGRYVSEVNVTSPTGLRAIEGLEGHDLGDRFLDFAEQKVSVTS